MRHRVVRVLLTGWILLAAALVAWAGGAEDEWVGRPAPDFTLRDLDGATYRLSDLTGKKIVWLNFWGLRCGPCIRELPVLQVLWDRYRDKGLLLLGVNADGVDAAFIRKQFEAREDLRRAGVTFPLAPDPEFGAIDAYGLMGAPLNVMIDRKGVIRFRHEGYEAGDEARYEALLKQLLAE